jgi:5-methylthioadenosine/S-adenosylhomocysteine deaminase
MTVTASLLFVNGLVLSMDASRHVWQSGFVAIEGDRIVAVGPMQSCEVVANRTLDLHGDLVMPGLVNCHGHFEEAIHRGFFDEASLAEWMNVGFWPCVRVMTQAMAYASARLAIAELLLSGVTSTAASECSVPNADAIDGALRAATESGIRAVVSRTVVDSPVSLPASQSVPIDLREGVASACEEVLRLRRRWNSGRVQVVPEPLNMLRCTPEMIQSLSALAVSEACDMHMHVASSRSEVEGSLSRYGRRPIEQLSHLKALGPHLLIAHCVWPSPAEIALLRDTGTRVSHNPVANLQYAEGIAPLSEMLEAGVVVGLGTDGSSTNNSQNLWETMKFSMFLQKHRLERAEYGSAEHALELATLGGAAAIGLGREVGSLEVGKKADIIVVDSKRTNLVPTETIVSNMVYAGNPAGVTTVLVGGDILVEGGRLVRWNLDDVVAEAQAAAAEVVERTNLAPVLRGKSRWLWDRQA